MAGEGTGAAESWLSCRLLEFDSLPSSNTWALEHLSELGHGDVVWARRQTAGRGRMDRRWSAQGDRSLTCSIILRDAALVPLAPNLGQLAGCAVVDCLGSLGIEAQLKWPNDVMAADRKIAGMLVEQGPGEGTYVVGIGLNINLSEADMAAFGLDRPAISMRIITGLRYTVGDVLRSLLERFGVRLDEALESGLAPLRAMWERHDWLAGRRVRVTAADGDQEGDYLGIDEVGRLRLHTASGVEARCWTGDVERVAVVEAPALKPAPVVRQETGEKG